MLTLFQKLFPQNRRRSTTPYPSDLFTAQGALSYATHLVEPGGWVAICGTNITKIGHTVTAEDVTKFDASQSIEFFYCEKCADLFTGIEVS